MVLAIGWEEERIQSVVEYANGWMNIVHLFN